MHTLTNDQLRVDVLDPVADRIHMGARYCTGGYIFQIHDHALGPLLSGPSYPGSFTSFNGQGIPDAFNLSPLRAVGDADRALIIGVGLCQLMPDYRNNQVLEFCVWQVEGSDSSISMRTSQQHAVWSLALARTVSLLGRTVRTTASVVNTGSEAIPLRWFPHPFYPQPIGADLIKLNMPVRFPANDGYVQTDRGFIARMGEPGMPGHYQALDHAAQAPLVVQQRHPLLGLITATTSYVPAFFPIWGNANTFSWEPFLERAIAPGQELAWFIDYDF